jgi:hypothetical protein
VAVACTSGGAPTSSTPSATTIAPTAVATTPAPTPLPSPSPTLVPGSTWEAVPASGPPDHALSVTWFDEGWVAVGTTCSDAGCSARIPAAWRSTDGRTWTGASSVPAATYGEMTVVASDGRAIYAAGTTGHLTGMVWRSLDGDRWEIVGSGTLFGLGVCFEGCPSMTGIGVGPAGVVVLGYRVTVKSGKVTSDDAIWSSADGTGWVRVDGADLGSSGTRIDLGDVAAGGPGFVAVGQRFDRSGGLGQAAALTSVDGRHWSSASALPDGDRVVMQHVAVARSGIVALGQRCTEMGGCAAVTWRSVDAVAWEPMVIAGDAIFYEHGLLAPAGETLVLLGMVDQRVTAWTSTDARAWTPQPPSDAFAPGHELAIEDLAGGPGRLAAIGYDQGTETFLTWLSPAGR